MRGGGVALWSGMLLLAATVAGAGTGQASGNGVGYLNGTQLRSEVRLNRMMRSYIGRNGLPDVAERRFLSDQPPWDRYEITLYYFDMHKRISFTKAYVLGVPSYEVRRDERSLTDQDIARLEAHAGLLNDGSTMLAAAQPGTAVARAEAAAARAEDAAGRVEVAATRAESAAARAEAVVEKMAARRRRR